MSMYDTAKTVITKELQSLCNDNFVRNISDGIRVYTELLHSHWGKQYICNILEYSEGKNTEYGTPYGELIGIVMAHLGHTGENGTNYQGREMRLFVSWAIEDIQKKKLAELSASKLRELESLKKKQVEIQKEIEEIMVPKKPAGPND